MPQSCANVLTLGEEVLYLDEEAQFLTLGPPIAGPGEPPGETPGAPVTPGEARPAPEGPIWGDRLIRPGGGNAYRRPTRREMKLVEDFLDREEERRLAALPPPPPEPVFRRFRPMSSGRRRR
jgi:hypothetical protein